MYFLGGYNTKTFPRFILSNVQLQMPCNIFRTMYSKNYMYHKTKNAYYMKNKNRTKVEKERLFQFRRISISEKKDPLKRNKCLRLFLFGSYIEKLSKKPWYKKKCIYMKLFLKLFILKDSCSKYCKNM